MRKTLCKGTTGELLKVKEDGTTFISLYNDGNALTPVEIAKNLKKLQVVFPKQSNEFFNVLTERLVANKFTEQRLRDAVNTIIDKFKYRELNISDIIQYDKQIKLYSYANVCYEISEHKASFKDFEKYKRIRGQLFWVKKSDLD